jgi:hypothetical protein
MKKLLILLFLTTSITHAKGGLVWKAARTAAAGYIAYQAHNRISDKIADTIADEAYIRWRMLRDKSISRKTAQKEIDLKQAELHKTTGIKHESLVRVLITLATFELSKAILDGYVYESLTA